MEGFSYPNATSYIMSEILWGKKKKTALEMARYTLGYTVQFS